MNSPIENDLQALSPEKDAARFLSVSQRTLQAWRVAGLGPPFIKMGRAIRYCRRDLIAWTESKRR
jgi:hypothetical protein